MKILLVGSGGREHAIAWKLARSRHVPNLIIAPGNAGTAALGENVPVKAMDLPGMVKLAKARGVDFVFVAPDDPLAAGMVDEMQKAGIMAFGPTAAAARIESSKVWAKQLMIRNGIPTARVDVFDNASAALSHIERAPEGSIVIKVDGLAQGKGVVVPATRQEAVAAVRSMMEELVFGNAGRRILVEERMSGPEVSVFAFVCGSFVSDEIAACDYKRVNDGDTGPNTGGMGAYSPPEFWTPELAARVRREVLEPVARAMVKEGCPFNGVLYAGLMLTSEGPRVVEFNCRLGDPEAQVILPRLESDLVDICLAMASGTLSKTAVRWGGDPHVGVVLASGGYPGKYPTGYLISGLAEAANDALIFHAGTKIGPGSEVLTNGGRVVMAVGSGKSVASARGSAYRSTAKIKFEGAHYRMDIAARSAASGSHSRQERAV
ncbi:MAG: phosphoribosylamine--glycine ligase [Dehalococcoidia bacterium]|nr:phosphoribosylamine--glycine ligase [Dehalococcoidia bacterium]MSQ34769.1 phosphoribosylamine--glycine ligase [Dehalococcoidia bacterium]